MPFFISFPAFDVFFIASLCIYFRGVAAQTDCLARKIPELQNAEMPSGLKEWYSHTESERFSCNVGFVGFFRLTCRNGVWSKTGQCQAKQCGHPGDTLNGDFTLAVGDDFVFGSMVQYTCRKGYTMASRISHRTCLLSGWDNIVPFCEVVKCEPLNPPKDLDVSGNFEAPQYSDVVEFECKSPGESLRGARQIYCTDTGDWSGQIPTCQETSCTRPEIPNSIPDGKNVIYKKDDIIRFQCVQHHIAIGSGIARCTRDGWTMSVRCEEFTCKVPDGQFLDFKSFHATEYKVGETVNYECLERYKKTEEFATCTLSNWRPQKMCEEIICTQIPNGYYTKRLGVLNIPYHWRYRITYGQYSYECSRGFMKTQPVANCTADGWAPENPCEEITCIKPPTVKLDDGGKVVRYGRHGYSCEDGYRKTSREAKCTEDGLVSANLCERECDMPALRNGYMVRAKHESAISYACDEGYKPKTKGWWGYITCTNGEWSDTPECIDENRCSDLPAIAHGRSKKTKNEYLHGDSVEVECDVGYSTKCISGSLKVPACTAEEGCNNTTDKSNGDAASDDCRLAKCINGEWQLPQCIKCDMPTLRNGYMVRAKHESAISYACDEGYKPKTEGWWGYVTCTNGEWSDTPKCIANNSCRALPVVYNKKIHKDEYSDGAKIEIHCHSGNISKCIDVKLECTENCTRFDNETRQSRMDAGCEAECKTDYAAACDDGEWTFPPCSDEVKDSPCDIVLDRKLENKRIEESITKQIR